MDFDKAENQLRTALGFLSEDSSSCQDIKDELYFHLPLHKAQWLLEKRMNSALEKTLSPMKDYIKDHPKRFEFIQAIDKMESFLAMSDNQICAEIKVQARNTLIQAQVFFAEWGRTPTLEDLNKNRTFKQKYPVEILASGNDVLSLKVTDNSKRCWQGGIYIISSPGLPTDGWQ